jgi:uncharacterized protein (TIGR00369 family)
VSSTVSTAARSRTHVWDDPSSAAAAAANLSGLDFLEAIAAGEIPPPPIMSTLGVDDFSVGPGWARFTLTPAEHHYNPIGSVHGGVAATLLDSALGCAIHSALPAGTGYTTVDLRVTFVRPLTATTGPVHCEGRVIHVGGRVATSEGRITDADGKLYAHGSATCLVFGGER